MTSANSPTSERSGRRAEPVLRPDAIRVGRLTHAAGHWTLGIDLELALTPGGELEPNERRPEAEALAGEPTLDAPSTAGAEETLAADTSDAAAGKRPREATQPARLAKARAPTARRFAFDRKKFLAGYTAAFSKLDARQRKGLDALLTAAEADAALSDLRWLAYMLATVQHECAGTWRPIEEYGKGAGRPYGKPVVVTDPQGKKHRNVYYGRGYVQLTWQSNYRKMGKLLKNRLLYEPELALRPAVAYRIMSSGMRRGLFTGKKLADYIRGDRCDYVNARRIINALDQAQKLARNARTLEKILRRSCVTPAARRAKAPAEEARATSAPPTGEPARASSGARTASRAVAARYHGESDWLSTFDGRERVRWDALALNREAKALRKADGFNVPAKHQPELWQWKPGDATTLKWRPQGITGSREEGSPERAAWLAVSWYGLAERGNAHRGARISLVDLQRGSPSHLQYRHVLLVQDARNIDKPELFRLPAEARRYQQLGGFAPVPIHAGGIAWVGDRLYVADTTLGLRVFDLTRLHAVEADETQARCGAEGGRMQAFNYAYVLPQVGYYRLSGTSPNSFVSVGRGASGRCLWSGQYLKKDSKRTPSLFGWPLEASGAIDTARAPELFQPNEGGGPVFNMQGAYRAGGATWMTVTGRAEAHGSTARLVTQAPRKKGLRWRWPHGAEDLYLAADTQILWCLTEYAASEGDGERVVFGVSFPTYAPSAHSAA